MDMILSMILQYILNILSVQGKLKIQTVKNVCLVQRDAKNALQVGPYKKSNNDMKGRITYI